VFQSTNPKNIAHTTIYIITILALMNENKKIVP
jgi:hypothetical protein